MTRAAISAGVLASVLAGAAAAAPSRVVLLRAPSEDRLAEQGNTLLAAELRAAGFEVIARPRNPARDIRADIDAASAELAPIATYAILPAPDGAAVELWLADRVTGKLVIRRIDVDRNREAAADLAVRAMELLRGSLLEVALPPPAPATPAVPPPEDVTLWIQAAVPEQRRPYFSTGVGVAVGATALASAGLGPTYAPTVRVSWGSRRGLMARLTLAGLGSSRALRAAEGTADVRQDLALAELGYVLRPGARLEPFVGGGAGVRRAHASGMGISPLFPDGQGTAYAAVVALGGGVAARLGDRLTLVLDGGLVLARPSTRITINTVEVGRVGTAALIATFTIATTF